MNVFIRRKIKKVRAAVHKLARGFTLIELLVVISIVGIMATIGTIAVGSIAASARDTIRKNDLKTIAKALDLYNNDFGNYPTTGGAYRGACSNGGSYSTSGTNAYVPNVSPTYIADLPSDPREGKNTTSLAGCTAAWACYIYRSDGTNYKLLALCTIEKAISPTDPFYDPVRPVTAYRMCNDFNSVGCNTW